jgi:hypothetical protein
MESETGLRAGYRAGGGGVGQALDLMDDCVRKTTMSLMAEHWLLA